MGKHGAPLLRLVFSMALVVFVLTRVEVSRVVDSISGMRPGLLMVALLIIVVERLLLAWKWRLLLGAKQVRVPMWHMIKICYATGFAGSFLPSSLGVDVLRSYSLYRHGAVLGESVSSVVADRLLSMSAMLLLALVCMPLYLDTLSGTPLRWMVPVVIVVAGAGLVCIPSGQVMSVCVYPLRCLGRGLSDRVMRLHGSLRDYLARPETVAAVLGLSLGFQLLRVTGVYFIGWSLATPGFTFLLCLAFVPVIILLTMLPISVGGFGVREGAFVYLFAQVGTPVSDAFTLSVVVYLVGLISLLPGAVIFARQGLAARKEPHGNRSVVP